MAGRTGGTGRVPGIPLQKKGAVSLLRLSKSQRGIVVVSLTLGNGNLFAGCISILRIMRNIRY